MTPQCRAIAEKILKKSGECKLAPCSFNGVHQPSLAKTFAREDLYIFSYFFDRTAPLGMPESFTLNELNQLTSTVCAGESEWKAFESVKFEGEDNALAQLRDRPEWCMDLSFMTVLLHTGYEIPLSREVKIAKKIKNNELGWCLGARLVHSLPSLSNQYTDLLQLASSEPGIRLDLPHQGSGLRNEMVKRKIYHFLIMSFGHSV